MKYIIISPVRNEELYIQKTIESMVQQSVKPCEWIIVDDGSQDKTREIAEVYSIKYPWIRVVRKEDRGFTQVGKGVIETFKFGFVNISCNDWEYVVKMDCDLVLPDNFFELLLRQFKNNTLLGIAGGVSCYPKNGNYIEEKMPSFHPWAGARMYNRKCFGDIGGLAEVLGWDTIDLLRAQMHGWKTEKLNNLRIFHLRRMSSRKGLWEGKLRLGRNFYITGYHPLFLIARSIYRIFDFPPFIESAGVIVGYLISAFKREKLVVTREEIKFLQNQQIRRLFGFKS